MGRSAFWRLAAGLMVALVAACGDGPATPAATSTPAVTNTPASASVSPTALPAVPRASDLVPRLGDAGFNQTVPETLPNTGQVDIAFSVYEKGAVQARAEVRVYPTAQIADSDFELQAQGWKNPPPGLFGGDPGNLDASALEGLDEAVAYIASNRDPQGFRLWTDVYRIGRVIVVAHVLAQNEADAAPVRQALADAVRAKLR